MRAMTAAVLIAIATSAPAAQNDPSAVTAWVAVAAPGATTTLAFVEIKNPTMYDIYVTGATADLAAKVELRSAAAGGQPSRVVSDFVVLAYGSTEAASSAPHLLLVDLARPLVAGDTVRLTLTTDGGVRIMVAAPVRTP